MSLLAPPATGSPHAQRTAAAQRRLCSSDQGNEPPGTCTVSLVGRRRGGGESCRGKAASPRFAMPAFSRADGEVNWHVWPLQWCVLARGHLELPLMNLPGATGWPPLPPARFARVPSSSHTAGSLPGCAVCSVPTSTVRVHWGFPRASRYRRRLQRLRALGASLAELTAGNCHHAGARQSCCLFALWQVFGEERFKLLDVEV